MQEPRATIDDYGDFGFRLMSSSVRRLPGSDRVDMDERFVVFLRGIVGMISG